MKYEINNPVIQEHENAILQLKSKVALNMLEMGDHLNAVKGMLEHGQFTEWLSNNVSLSVRTANNYMRAAAAFPESKRKSISNLTSTSVLLLSELPEDIRGNFTEKYSSEELEAMSSRELKEAIRQEKQNSDVLSHFAATVEEGYQVFDIDIDKLKPYAKHNYYLEPFKGQKYIERLQSINQYGSPHMPVLITKDNIIIDGYERVRACKDLGIKTIKARYAFIPAECILQTYEDSLEAVFLFYQAWDRTRTSDFYYGMALYNDKIGDTEKAEYFRFTYEILGKDKLDEKDIENLKVYHYWTEKQEKCYHEYLKRHAS